MPAEDHANNNAFRIAPIPMDDVLLYIHHERATDMMNRGMIPQKNSRRNPRKTGKTRRFSRNNGR